jgi:hypothetical protein
MARKRVSLKDKGPETLGLTEKKGQGIDVLFGGPAAPKTRVASASVSPESITNQPKTEEKNMAAENKDTLTNSGVNVSAVPESLPVNEADHDLTVAAAVETDELGLPVAMEAPPSRMAATRVGSVEVDELGLPVAMEAPPTDLTMPVPPSAPPPVAATVDSDRSSLADDNDLSGLAGEEVAPTPAEVAPAPPPADMPPPAPVESAPASPVPPPVTMPEPSPVEAAPPPVPVAETPIERPLPAPPPITADYTPPTYVPPPTPVVAPVPVAPPPPPPVIESIGGILAQAGPVNVQSFLPQDYEYAAGTLQLAERAEVAKDDLLSEKVERYLGKERRDALDQEIERLYEVVSNELSDNTEDASFALKILREAQEYVLEDIRQYDEALYRVAMVKTMLVRRRNLKRWSYSWGSFVFLYAIAWLAFFITAIVFTGNINNVILGLAGESGGLVAASTAWYSALAGGIGGVIGILYSLYWRVAVKQNFDRQYIMYYLVQPIMGFMLGAVTHLIITAGFLTFNASGATSQITVILQMVIGFVAGFRQRVVYQLIDNLVQKIAPEESDRSPESVRPG